MAEKEERILIKKQINYHPPYGGWRGDKKALIMSRKEAIEKMAYAMLKADDPEAANEWLQLQWNSTRIRKHYMVMAEAALNSLLGEDK